MLINQNGSSDNHAKFTVTSGVMMHNDITIAIAAAGPTIPVMYFSTANVPRFTGTTGFAFLKGANYICYNDGGTYITEADSGRYILAHIFAVNEHVNAARKVISVMGQAQYSTLVLAYAGAYAELNFIYANMPQQGRCLIGSVVYKADNDFTNSVKTIIVGVAEGHKPVTIATESAELASIDENQVLTLTGLTDGDDAYVYIAYASDASGTDFTNTFDAGLDYIAILSTDTEIVTPVVGDFAGLWKNYGGGGGLSTVTTDLSVTGDGSKETPVVLVGDEDTPGNNKYYGTNAAGTKGFHSFPAALLVDKDFEFCVSAGVAQTETLDLYATAAYTIEKLVAESDGTLTSVTVKIGATAVTGIDAVSVGTLASFRATAAKTVAPGTRVTIVIGTGYSGTPTKIRGKLIISA